MYCNIVFIFFLLIIVGAIKTNIAYTRMDNFFPNTVTCDLMQQNYLCNFYSGTRSELFGGQSESDFNFVILVEKKILLIEIHTFVVMYFYFLSRCDIVTNGVYT